MGIFSIILIILWLSVIADGIFALVKGYFPREQDKVKKHEPNAYRKWIRFSSIFVILCGVINVILSILDGFSGANDFKYVIFTAITVVIVVAVVAIAYARIVKPADKALGIESEFDKIFENEKK